jgi:hypothetical protein
MDAVKVVSTVRVLDRPPLPRRQDRACTSCRRGASPRQLLAPLMRAAEAKVGRSLFFFRPPAPERPDSVPAPTHTPDQKREKQEVWRGDLGFWRSMGAQCTKEVTQHRTSRRLALRSICGRPWERLPCRDTRSESTPPPTPTPTGRCQCRCRCRYTDSDTRHVLSWHARTPEGGKTHNQCLTFCMTCRWTTTIRGYTGRTSCGRIHHLW